MSARNLGHCERCVWLGTPGSLSNAAIDCPPVAILHQHMTHIAEIRLRVSVTAFLVLGEFFWKIVAEQFIQISCSS
jgi:hypothetical protein